MYSNSMKPVAERKPFYAHEPEYLELQFAEAMVQDGWLAQFRGTGLIAKSIQKATGGVHSHSAMFARDEKNKAVVLEMREFKGGNCLGLWDYLNNYDVEIDIFRIDDRYPDFDGARAAEVMNKIIKGPQARGYSYFSIARMLVRKFPLIWHLFRKPSTDDEQTFGNNRAFCSQAVAEACRIGGGIDPVPNLPDAWVDPNMLTRSLLFTYYGTVKG